MKRANENTVELTGDELRDNVDEVLEGVETRSSQYVITREGKDVAILLPAERADEALRAWGRQELARILERSRGRNADVTDDEVADLVEREIQAHRAEKTSKPRENG